MNLADTVNPQQSRIIEQRDRNLRQQMQQVKRACAFSTFLYVVSRANGL